MANADEPSSLDLIQKSELYPKKSLKSEDAKLQVPFPLLCGESVEYLGRTASGVISLSNFRIFIHFKDSFMNIPLGLVDYVERQDMFYINIYCKDATVARCAFSDNDSCQTWFRRLAEHVSVPKELKSYFAFAFSAWCQDSEISRADHDICYQLCNQEKDYSFKYSFGLEVNRMKFNTKKKEAWRITYINEKYGVCSSYPQQHIVPACISDEDLQKVADFRALRRFPSVVWRDQRNGAVIVRSSQPEVGWLYWRNMQDEALLRAIPKACMNNPGTYHKQQTSVADMNEDDSDQDCEDSKPQTDRGMMIIDCRSYSAAQANRAKGGGLECPEYYPNCDIQFMNLANIHSIRKSFVALRLMCSSSTDHSSWLTSLESTKWLAYVSNLMKVACTVTQSIDKDCRPVLVHCSDGWDRTPQITSLAQILLDPYYRTLEGFQCLIEREWLEFGHKFADRCGNGVNIEDTGERSPVFLQFLDCVYQIWLQFPCAFQFNEAYLIKLLQHTYSMLFGTFLCNDIQTRQKEELHKRTASVWSLLNSKSKKFVNQLFLPTLEQQVLYPCYLVKSLRLWNSVYLSNNSLSTQPEEVEMEKGPVAEPNSGMLPKTRSCENLLAATDQVQPGLTRRRSDPNINLDSFEKNLQIGKDGDCDNLQGVPNGVRVSSGPTPLDNENSAESKGERTKQIRNSASNQSLCNGKDSYCLSSEKKSDVSVQINGFCAPKTNGKNVCDTQNMSNGFNHDGYDRECCRNHSECNETEADNTSSGETHCQEIGDFTEDLDFTSDSECTLHTSSSLSINKIESSTDTLCDEESRAKEFCDASRVKSAPTQSTETSGANKPSICSNSTGHINSHSNFPTSNMCTLKKLESSSSISTSTSDISNSHIHLEMESFYRLPNLGLTQGSQVLRLDCSAALKFKAVANGSSGLQSPGYPVGCKTPASTCPTTPDARSTESQKVLHSISRHLDVDGLTAFHDPVQQRIEQMQSEFHRKISILIRHIEMRDAIIKQYPSSCSGAGRCGSEITKDDYLMYLESKDQDMPSLDSNAASDVSWEQIDEGESLMTRWIPDHAVTNCAKCGRGFGLIYRKHHCRNCGNVFCHDCSNFYLAIPQQNLPSPERVCLRCYNSLSSTKDMLIDSRPLAAAASN